MKRLRFVALCAALLALLSACGGHHHRPATQQPPPVVTPMDAFFKAVLAVIGMSSDTAEPADITATAVTAPDNTEPEKVE
jgi:ABC-type uncharacterized transport system auxiliary subunit